MSRSALNICPSVGYSTGRCSDDAIVCSGPRNNDHYKCDGRHKHLKCVHTCFQADLSTVAIIFCTKIIGADV
jgi:hypothetical protein